MDRKHKLIIGTLTVSEETFVQDMLALDSMISEMVWELREAGKELRRDFAGLERIETPELRETNATGVHVNWQAASGAQSSLAEVSCFGELGGIYWKGQRWKYAQEVEGSGAEGLRGNAGTRAWRS